MITLERLEAKIDALTAGLNSVLEGQQKLMEGHTCLNAQIGGLGDGLVDEIKQLTAAVSFFAQTALNRKNPPRPAKRGKRAAPRSR